MLKLDGDRVWSSDQAVFPEAAPASIGIIGAGAIGMEFADVYASFGSQVMVIEAMDRVLPLEDKDASALLARLYRKRGIEVLEGARLEQAEVGSTGVKLTVAGKDGKSRVVEVERVLVAVGRAPIVEDIGLERAGVALENGFIKVDEYLRTNVPGVYAIGDVARPPLLAHKASHEGIVCVEAIAGQAHGPVDYHNIPNVTYCHPEVASVGLTEEKAREQKLDIEVGSFPFSASGRARTAGETDGFVKVIRDKRYSEILGAHIVGPHASELIAEFVVGRHLETTAEEMERAMHPHPTLSEAVAEAALAALGRPIHI
jgi:dihydrolipoamide dehydrogenase